MSKILEGLLKQMDKIFQESEDIFFAIKPWLEDPGNPAYQDKDGKYIFNNTPELLGREEQNQFDKEEIFKEIEKEQNRLSEKKPQVMTQEQLV